MILLMSYIDSKGIAIFSLIYLPTLGINMRGVTLPVARNQNYKNALSKHFRHIKSFIKCSVNILVITCVAILGCLYMKKTNTSQINNS